jgi:CMP-N-acetylneuraminic acid synthetase
VNICYIQSRAGSKRFPKKALALWKGKPMVADAIEKAQATGLFDYIAVSSDDHDVLQIAVDYGVLPLWRSPATAGDTATDDDVAREVLRYFPKAKIVCKLYPCVPLMDYRDISRAFYCVASWNDQGVYSVDVETQNDAGAFYVFSNEAFQGYQTIALNSFPWEKMYVENACDINTPDDLEKAKIKAGI